MARFSVNLPPQPQRRVTAAVIAAAAAAVSALAACYYLAISPAWSAAANVHAISFPKVASSLLRSRAPSAAALPRSKSRSSALDEPWQTDFAFAVLTGSLTAQRRVPLQQLTMFSYSIRNFILIGAGADPGHSADLPILDVATPVRERLDALHAELKVKAAAKGSSESSAEEVGGDAATQEKKAGANSSNAGSGEQVSGDAGGQEQSADAQPAAGQGAAVPSGGEGPQEAGNPKTLNPSADQQPLRRRMLQGLQQHPLWRAWLRRCGGGTAAQHSRHAQRPRQRRRQRRHRQHRRLLHQPAQRRLQIQRWGPTERQSKVQPLSNGSSRLQRRGLSWVSMDTAGQAMNRYKGVPGLQALYRAFPNAKWYIMIDDDTYFFMYNFRNFVAHWDSDAVHYFGNTMSYETATNPHTGEEFQGGRFAHGGEGIIVSRAAMRRFAGMYDQCIDRVLESGFGVYTDTQIALCMRLAGVEYNNTAVRFNHFLINDPPGLATADQAGVLQPVRQWPLQHPCSRPHSVHHLQPEHMQALYEAESAAPGLRPTYEDVWRALRRNFVTEALEQTLRVPDVWIIGNAASITQTDSADACEAACEARPGCVAWQWGDEGGRACKLHDGWREVQALEADRKGEIVSGVLLHQFVCNETASTASPPT